MDDTTMAANDINTAFGKKLTRPEFLSIRQKLRNHRGRAVTDIADVAESPGRASRTWKGRATWPLTDQTSSGRRLKPALWLDPTDREIKALRAQPFYRHAGRELIHVQQGTLKVQFLGQHQKVCVLGPGERDQVIDFATDIPHRFEIAPEPGKVPGFRAIIVAASDVPRKVQNAPYLENASDPRDQAGDRFYRYLENNPDVIGDDESMDARERWISARIDQYVRTVADYRSRRIVLAHRIDELLSESRMGLYKFLNGPTPNQLGTIGFLSLVDDLLLYAQLGNDDDGLLDGLHASLEYFSKTQDDYGVYITDEELVPLLRKLCEERGDAAFSQIENFIANRFPREPLSAEDLQRFHDGDEPRESRREVMRKVKAYFVEGRLQPDVETLHVEIRTLRALGQHLSYQHLALMISQQCNAYGLSNEELARLAYSTTYWQNLKHKCDEAFLIEEDTDPDKHAKHKNDFKKTELGVIAEIFDIDVDDLFMIPLAIKGRSYDTYGIEQLKDAASDDLERQSHTGTGAMYSEVGRYRGGEEFSAYLVKITDSPAFVSCVTHPDEDEFDLVLEGTVRAHYDPREPHDAVMTNGEPKPERDGDHAFLTVGENSAIFLAAGEYHAWSKAKSDDIDPLILTVVSTARHGTSRVLHTAPLKKGEIFESTRHGPERARQRWLVTRDSARARFGANARPGDAVLLHIADFAQSESRSTKVGNEAPTIEEHVTKTVKELNHLLQCHFPGVEVYSEDFEFVTDGDDLGAWLPSRMCDTVANCQDSDDRKAPLLVVIHPKASKNMLESTNADATKRTLTDLLGSDEMNAAHLSGWPLPAEPVLYWVRAAEVRSVFPREPANGHHEKWHLLEPDDFVIRTNKENLDQLLAEAQAGVAARENPDG